MKKKLPVWQMVDLFLQAFWGGLLLAGVGGAWYYIFDRRRFGVFTFRPPQIPFFEDPQTGIHGYMPVL